MKIELLRFSNIKSPRRMHDSDTGADIFMPKGGTIVPHETRIIPAGFGIDIPKGYTGKIQVRTSVAVKGIITHTAAIDAGYKGEIHIIITNLSNKPFTWKKNDRLCYIEVYPCIYPIFETKKLHERLDKGIGSTGK